MELLIEVVSTKKNEVRSFKHVQSKFSGTLEGNSFKIQRIIKYRNSFLPVIHGKVYNSDKNTEVSITMTPSLSTSLFLVFWLGIAGYPLFLFVLGGEIETFKAIFSTGMLGFGYLLATIGFGFEANRAEKELMGMFSEREIRDKS